MQVKILERSMTLCGQHNQLKLGLFMYLCHLNQVKYISISIDNYLPANTFIKKKATQNKMPRFRIIVT